MICVSVAFYYYWIFCFVFCFYFCSIAHSFGFSNFNCVLACCFAVFFDWNNGKYSLKIHFITTNINTEIRLLCFFVFFIFILHRVSVFDLIIYNQKKQNEKKINFFNKNIFFGCFLCEILKTIILLQFS